MARSLAIAGIVVSLLAWLVPFYGMFMAAFAILLAIAAALAGEKALAASVPLIVGTNLFFASPLFWATVNGASLDKHIPVYTIYAGVLAFVVLPYAAMILNAVFATSQPQLPSRPPASSSPLPTTTGDPGEDTWRLIETSRDKALLDEFVAKFPDHPRAMMARILSERIGKTTDVAHEPVLPAEAGIPFVPPEGMAISSKQPRTRDENKPNADNYPLRLALIILGLLIAFTAVLGAPAWIHLLKY